VGLVVGLAISVFSGGRMALVRLQRSGKRLLQPVSGLWNFSAPALPGQPVKISLRARPKSCRVTSATIAPAIFQPP
jgi:hypothetical protein